MNQFLHEEVDDLRKIAKDTESFYQAEYTKLHDKLYTLEGEKHNLINQLRETRRKTDPMISRLRDLTIENEKYRETLQSYDHRELETHKAKVDLEMTAANFEKLLSKKEEILTEEIQKRELAESLLVEQKGRLGENFNKNLDQHKIINKMRSDIFELTKDLETGKMEYNGLLQLYKLLEDKFRKCSERWDGDKTILFEDLVKAKKLLAAQKDKLTARDQRAKVPDVRQFLNNLGISDFDLHEFCDTEEFELEDSFRDQEEKIKLSRGITALFDKKLNEFSQEAKATSGQISKPPRPESQGAKPTKEVEKKRETTKKKPS